MPYVNYHILTPREVYNADHWRRRATLTLEKAKYVEDPELKTRLMRVATEYQKLAKYADDVKAALELHKLPGKERNNNASATPRPPI
jgi:hypothetical protein